MTQEIERFCKRCGPEAWGNVCECEDKDSRLMVHFCQAPKCRVMLFDPDEPFCQHHEGQAIFDQQHGTNTFPQE